MNRRDAVRAVMAMPAVASISVANVKPDDVIVIECDEHLKMEQIEAIRERAEQVWPGRKIAVMGRGLHVKVMRQETP